MAPLQHPRARFFTFAALVALVVIYPTWSSYYGLTVVRDGLVLGILALSLGFLWGKAGLPSFGHAAFFGLGGYTYGLATQHLDPAIGPIVGVVGAVAIGALVGLLLGVFLLRAGVRGALFLIVTVALTQISHQVAISWSWVTGGDGGLIGIPPLGFGIFGHDFVLFGIIGQYYLVLAIAVVLFGALWWVCRGRYGRLLAAIASDERRAETLGINAPLMLTSALTISTAIAGPGGRSLCFDGGLHGPGSDRPSALRRGGHVGAGGQSREPDWTLHRHLCRLASFSRSELVRAAAYGRSSSVPSSLRWCSCSPAG